MQLHAIGLLLLLIPLVGIGAADILTADTGDTRIIVAVKAEDDTPHYSGDSGDESDSGGTQREEGESQVADLIERIEISVKDASAQPVESAKVTLSAKNSGFSSKKITDDEGVATFTDVPVGTLDIKVTARGYKSHTGEQNLENGGRKIVVELKKRN